MARQLKDIPSVDEVIKRADIPSPFARDIVRAAIEEVRTEVKAGKLLSIEELLFRVRRRWERLSGSGIKKVVNATGTVLHTNLGRAQLSEEAIEALCLAAREPVNLEFSVETAARSDRDRRIEELLIILAGAESACVVNNNAAAVFLTLNTLSEGKEVVVSRGELIEIGGSFRLPEIIRKSGCILREVGTTNITRPGDYINAIGENTAVIFKAHKSNYRIVGFTEEVALKELSGIAHKKGVALIEDLGSGALLDTAGFGLEKEPLPQEALRYADIVTFSGDKLLGGPQAGLIVGKKPLIDAIRTNPLKRALRVDKLTVAALEATLRSYLKPDSIERVLPAYRFLSRPLGEIEKTALEAKELLEKTFAGYEIAVKDDFSIVGSGSLPGEKLPTKVLSITHREKTPEEIFRLFLDSAPAILGRINDDAFILDLRCVERAEAVCPAIKSP